MPKKDLTLTSKIVISLHSAEDLILPWISPKEFSRRVWYGGDYDSFKAIMRRLQKRGLVKYINFKENRFIKLTKKGELEALLHKARLPQSGPWDGKWRLIIFDIPEEANVKRDQFRRILKANYFFKLQASVFISPHPLNREAITYLKQTGLIGYVRILRVDEIDEDVELKKHFNLP